MSVTILLPDFPFLRSLTHSLPCITGFLSGVGTSNRGSNNVLMDQIAALHWIQETIGEFGGDASNVTIAGHGYGAACVNLLMLTDLGRGLSREFDCLLHVASFPVCSVSVFRHMRRTPSSHPSLSPFSPTHSLTPCSCLPHLSRMSFPIRFPFHFFNFSSRIVFPETKQMSLGETKRT